MPEHTEKGNKGTEHEETNKSCLWTHKAQERPRDHVYSLPYIARCLPVRHVSWCGP